MSQPRKQCGDYTDADLHNDYMRHRREGTPPCKASKRSWANRQKRVRASIRTGGQK